MNTHDARPDELVPDPLTPVETAAAASAAAAALGAALGAGAVRGAPEWRQLSFRTSGLTIELEITGRGEHRRLIGQLIPRQAALVEIRHTDRVTTAEADVLGRFSAEMVPVGQISLRCRLGTATDQSPVVTGWIAI